VQCGVCLKFECDRLEEFGDVPLIGQVMPCFMFGLQCSVVFVQSLECDNLEGLGDALLIGQVVPCFMFGLRCSVV